MERLETAPAQSGPDKADSTTDNSPPTPPAYNFALCERECAALELLAQRRYSPLELGLAIGARNCPEVIRQLRGKGLPVETHSFPHVDRYGRKGRRFEYELLDAGKAMYAQYKREANQ